MASVTSIGTVLAAFRVTRDPNSAWRKLPDWSSSINVSTAFATAVGNTQLDAADAAAKLAATQGLKRIRALAAAKAKAAQEEAQKKLQTAIDGLSPTTKVGPPGSVSYAGPQYGGLSGSASVSPTPGSTSGPRFNFKV